MTTENMVYVRVEFENVSLMPRDAQVNTWHFHQVSGTGGSPSDLDNVYDMLEDFYGEANGESPSIASLITRKYMSGKVTMSAYNMEAPKPRVPINTRVLDWASKMNNGVSPLPAETSLVLSYQATRQDGVRQARRRGRIYLPTFASNTMSDAGRPQPGTINAVRRAAAQLKRAADASITWEWVVWSPTMNDHSLVHDGWVDNEWDTLRSRGRESTARGAWDASTT